MSAQEPGQLEHHGPSNRPWERFMQAMGAAFAAERAERDERGEPVPLPEFLLERFAEDDADTLALGCGCDLEMDGTHVAYCPERMNADTAAKRRIVGKVLSMTGVTVEHDWLLGVLAAPYSNHPQYRQEWKP